MGAATAKHTKLGDVILTGQKLTCDSTVTKCVGTATLTVAKIHGSLGSAKITTLPGHTTLITIRLTKAGAALLKRRGKLSFVLTYRGGQPGTAASHIDGHLTIQGEEKLPE
jgi:hypothetical protein